MFDLQRLDSVAHWLLSMFKIRFRLILLFWIENLNKNILKKFIFQDQNDQIE
jgi:hypothetical protein